MTAKIFKFVSKDAKVPHHRKTDFVGKTNLEIFQTVIGEVAFDWETAAIKNKSNDYIASKLPPGLITDIRANYLNDLNIISDIEKRLGICVCIFSPGYTEVNTDSCLVSFKYNNESYSISSEYFGEISDESHIRAITLVIYTIFKSRIFARDNFKNN